MCLFAPDTRFWDTVFRCMLYFADLSCTDLQCQGEVDVRLLGTLGVDGGSHAQVHRLGGGHTTVYNNTKYIILLYGC